MKPSLGTISVPYLLVIFGAALSMALGISVLYGWYTHHVALIQVSTAFVPMQFNTALGFVLSGLGLLLVTRARHGAGMALGISVMFMGLLTLAEYVLEIDLGIDQLLMKHYISVKTSHPGRMAPNTAVCFALTGVALILFGTKAKFWSSTLIAGVLGSLIFGLGFIALAGYTVSLETAYGWGELTRMAVHTASGFVFLGVAVTGLAWQGSTSGPLQLPSWLPVPIGIGMVTITISLWQALTAHQALLMETYGSSGGVPFVNQMVLMVGMVLAFEISLAVYLVQTARSREIEVAATNRRLAAEIDERKQADQRLKESEEKFSKAFHFHPTAMQILNLDTGERLEINKRCLELYEVDNIEALNKSIFTNNRWINAGAQMDSIQQLIRDGFLNDYPVEIFANSGEARNLLANAAMLDIDDGKSAIISYVDITKRKRAEEALRESEERLRAIVDTARESIITSDTQGNIVGWSKGAQSAFGYSVDEIIGQSLTLIIPERYRQDHRISLQRVAAGRAPNIIGKLVELHGLRKDGNEFPLELSLSVWASGERSFFTAIIRDVTEKKQLTEELVQHRHHLEELVEQRTAQLAEARKKAEAANQAKSTFLANMSHEIRTPMNAIVGLTHLLQRAEPTPEQAEQLAKIEVAARHLLSIINDILDLSKIEAGKLSLEQTDFCLDAIFDHIRSLFREQVTSKAMTIAVHLNEVPQWLRGDLTRLRQALLNYVSNAIKFTHQGTILLRALKLEENDDGVLVRFEVQDHGIGIEPDRLASLFEAFEQADASTTRHHGGTGLGLAITQRLAQLMGGEVGAESAPGQGSTFWFTARLGRGRGVMPLAPSAEKEDAEIQLQAHHMGSRILLVEDNDINREVAVALLSGAGLMVDTAENGRKAVAKVRATDYDLVLMDIQMPEMDGLEATLMIRSMAGNADLPILAMTANVFEEDRLTCLKAGMNDFVAKPIDVDILFSTLAKWLPGQSSPA